jgi:hypothetical protein
MGIHYPQILFYVSKNQHLTQTTCASKTLLWWMVAAMFIRSSVINHSMDETWTHTIWSELRNDSVKQLQLQCSYLQESDNHDATSLDQRAICDCNNFPLRAARSHGMVGSECSYKSLQLTGAWLIAKGRGLRHLVYCMVSMSQVFTLVTLFKCITCGEQLAWS